MSEEIPNSRKSLPDMSWRDNEFRATGKAAASRRRLWTVLLIGALLVLVALAVILLISPHSIAEPAYLSVSLGAYENANYPVVPFARQDYLRLERHFEKKPRAETKTKQLLLDNLQQLDLLGAGRPLIVHITALGRVWDGKVYLIPIDAKPDNPESWLAVDTVLDLVGKYKAPKLLILDLSHPLADARLGVLSDRVAEALYDQLQKNEPAYPVFLPCSPAQLSLASETMQSSVFAYYLDKGLEGEADGLVDNLKDNRVTVNELFKYVESQVERWARFNRLQQQKPRKLGKGADFTLVNLERSYQPGTYKPEASPYPDALRNGFAVRDAWSDRKDVRLPSAMYQSLEKQLLRQEQRWRGGYELQPLETAQIAEAELKNIGAATKSACPTAPVFSLAVAAADAATDPALAAAIQEFLEQVPEGPGQEAELAKLKTEFNKKLQEKKDADYYLKARAIIEALINVKDIHANQVRLAADVLESKQIGSPPGQRFVEPVYLRRLAYYADGLQLIGLKWRSLAVNQALKTMAACENVTALVSQEPALIPWLRSTVEKADASRRDGEKDLLWQVPSQGMPMEKLLAAEEGYKTAVRYFRALQRGRLALDEASALLPGYQPLLSEWPEYEARTVDTWHKAAGAARQIDEFFKLPNAGADPLRDLDRFRIPLEEQLKTLKNLLQERIDRADKAVAIDKDGKVTIKANGRDMVEQYLGLLRSPLLKSPTRVALCQKLGVLTADLQGRTDKQEADKAPPAKLANVWDPLSQALVRARLSLEMLTFNGGDARKLEQDVLPGVRDLDKLPLLEKGLLEAWSKRAADPAGQRNLIAGPRQKQCTEYISWMANRYRQEVRYLESADAKETDQGKAARSFFSNAKREFERLENPDQ